VFLFFLVIPLLTGCNHRSDSELRKKLPGTWVVEGSNTDDDRFKSAVTVDSSGHYVCQLVAHSRFDGVTRTYNIAGTFEVKNGLLIDTVTEHSNTNATLPMISRGLIVRANDRELAIRFDSNQELDFSTNEIVWRKEKK
jgi:hypothetical protein